MPTLGTSFRGVGILPNKCREDRTMQSRTVTLSCHSFNDLEYKVKAIKGARGLTNIGLKEAKELIERVTPGHSEIIVVGYDILEPRFTEYVTMLKDSGLTVIVSHANSAARKNIGKEIRKIVTYATMTSQYDVGRALLDLMETYCPDPEDEDEDDEDEQR
jgi:hypothetical protein